MTNSKHNPDESSLLSADSGLTSELSFESEKPSPRRSSYLVIGILSYAVFVATIIVLSFMDLL